ncbi:MAG: NAD-dependent epimerase/dehydratase family protein [Desulfobacterales bacterium]|nr:NAD-dependent epimerase/dehydratase family protein [Desulfobacterales bacterium]
MEFTGITLVTGAAGFMGSHLVEFLVRKGVRVRASARPRKDTSFFDRLGVEYVAADLTKPETLPRLFEGGVDRVFHLGAICNFSTPYESLYPTNVQGVKLITDLALKNGVKRYVHVGSTSVYGYYRGTPFQEDSLRVIRRIPMGEANATARMSSGAVSRKAFRPLSHGRAPFTGPDAMTARARPFRALPASVPFRETANSFFPTFGRKMWPPPFTISRFIDAAVGQAFNLAEDTHPTLEEALADGLRSFRHQAAEDAPASLAGENCRAVGRSDLGAQRADTRPGTGCGKIPL